MTHDRADMTAGVNQDLKDLVDNNSGQGSFEEYVLLRRLIRTKAPCNLLVFGVGKDSKFWLEANDGGTTMFIEHESEWIEKTREMLPGVIVHQVAYDTRRSQWKRLLHKQISSS